MYKLNSNRASAIYNQIIIRSNKKLGHVMIFIFRYRDYYRNFPDYMYFIRFHSWLEFPLCRKTKLHNRPTQLISE